MIGKITFQAMGCQMNVVLDTPDPQALDVLPEVPAWFEAWEQRFSRFRSDSELSWVNRQAGQPVKVSWEFAGVFEKTLQAAAWTDDLVTPAVYDAVNAAGYRTSFENLPSDGLREMALVNVLSLEAVRWDPQLRILHLPDGMHLDFGGSAKGWSAEQAAQRLQGYGDVMVDAGGDVAMSQLCQPDGDSGAGWRKEPWLVGVAEPFQANAAPADLAATLALWGGGVATSGRDRRRWKQAGVWQHHLMDPRRGAPAETEILTATVIAPDLYQAEAAAKCVLISGRQKGLAWLGQNPHLAALLILESGERLCTANFPAYEWKELEDEHHADQTS